MVALYPAYVGLYGVMTSTLLASPETVSHVHLLLCDPDELRALHAGEGAGDRHDFGVLDTCAVTLLTGRELPAPYSYSCARGVARIDGAPRRLARVAVDSSPVGAATFAEAMDWMVRRAAAAGLAVESHADIQRLVLDGRREDLLAAIRADAVEHRLAFTALSSPEVRAPVPDRRLGSW